MSEKIELLRKFLSTHRAVLAAGITATALMALMYKNAREIEKFMKEHELTDEYNKWLTGE